MKVLLFSAAVFAVVLAEVPAPPPGWRPSGRLLLVPARHVAYPPPADSPTSTEPQVNTTKATQESQSDESQSERLLDSGEYYVLLPDGRLQMVKYMTAALREESKKEASSQTSQFQQGQNSQYRNQFPDGSSIYQQQVKQEPFAQFKVEYVQYPQFAQPETKSAQKKDEETEESEYKTGFEANVQYRDVKPISAPIYAYNPTPLVRILKK